MRPFVLGILAAGAAASISTATGCGSSTSNATPGEAQATRTAEATHTGQTTPTRRPPLKEFRSQQYGYRIRVPRDASPNFALVDWATTTPPKPGSPGVDTYTEPDGQMVVVASARVRKGMTLDEWDSAVLGSTGVCTPKETFAPGTLGGEPALVGPGSCTDGYDYLQAEALHGRRGYLLMVVSATIDSRVPADPALFRTALHSFRFTSK